MGVVLRGCRRTGSPRRIPPSGSSKNSRQLPNQPAEREPGRNGKTGYGPSPTQAEPLRAESPNIGRAPKAGRGENRRFYLYKMTADNGGAPCVQEGLLTLAICEPSIRRVAPEGSVIIGFAGHCLSGDGYEDNSIVYAAVVSRRLADGEYYSRRQYARRPDCIYRRAGKRFARKARAVFHRGRPTLSTISGHHRITAMLSSC